MSLRPVNRLEIIFVDDDACNLKIVEDILTAFGASATTCSSPREALELMLRLPFHVVLLDIHMPEMTGIELLQRLRARPGPNQDAPALALTADLSRDEAQYRALGFDGFVAKPIVIRRLLATILDVLTVRQDGAAAVRPQAAARRR